MNATPPTYLSTLSLHDALPILSPTTRGTAARPVRTSTRRIWSCAPSKPAWASPAPRMTVSPSSSIPWGTRDRKSTRLNSSHTVISYAVFCLKKKKKTTTTSNQQTKERPTQIWDDRTQARPRDSRTVSSRLGGRGTTSRLTDRNINTHTNQHVH